MIVKNNEETLRDVLQNIGKYADAAFFLDTGSTDWTICAAEEWIQHMKIPGKVLDYHNRMGSLPSAAFTEAQKFLKTENFPLENTYLFLLDGDMIVDLTSNLDKAGLTKDIYLPFRICSPLKYCLFAPHLFRASLPPNPSSSGKLSQIRIYGGNRSLACEIEQLDPENNGDLFRLAHWHRANNRFKEALSFYQKRLDLGGDEEEIWFSKFMMGTCYENLSDWETAFHCYLEAFQMRPQYPDPIQKIAAHYRLAAKDDLAYLFATEGGKLSRSLSQDFFDDPPLEDYQFDEEISISAYYTQYLNEGFLAASRLAFSKNVVSWVKDQNNRNIFYYAPNLKNAHFKKLEIDLPLISKKSEERYHPMNLSILKTEGGFKLVCGATNYTQTGGKTYQTNDPRGIFKTRNFLLFTDFDFNILSTQEIVENLPRDRFRALNVEGLEDCRLFEFQGRDWLACATSDTSETSYYEVSLCKLPNDLSSSQIQIEELIPLPGPDPNRNEKNWLPFIKDGQIRFIYSYTPLIFFSFHPETKTCNVSSFEELSLDLSQLRGSASPIPFDSGYLMIGHTTVHYLDATKAHLHYFLYLDSNLRITHISRPFIFQHRGIEKCHSICLNHTKDKLIIPIGIEDREVYLCTIDTESVRSLLIPVDLFMNRPNSIP